MSKSSETARPVLLFLQSAAQIVASRSITNRIGRRDILRSIVGLLRFPRYPMAHRAQPHISRWRRCKFFQAEIGTSYTNGTAKRNSWRNGEANASASPVFRIDCIGCWHRRGPREYQNKKGGVRESSFGKLGTPKRAGAEFLIDLRNAELYHRENPSQGLWAISYSRVARFRLKQRMRPWGTAFDATPRPRPAVRCARGLKAA